MLGEEGVGDGSGDVRVAHCVALGEEGLDGGFDFGVWLFGVCHWGFSFRIGGRRG